MSQTKRSFAIETVQSLKKLLIVVNIHVHQSEICSVKENPTILMEYE